jgi:hypothetical protein
VVAEKLISFVPPAERDALGEMHAEGELDQTLFQELMRELDLDDERLR